MEQHNDQDKKLFSGLMKLAIILALVLLIPPALLVLSGVLVAVVLFVSHYPSLSLFVALVAAGAGIAYIVMRRRKRV